MTTEYGIDYDPFERALKKVDSRARSAFWIITTEEGTGRLVVLGPYKSEDDAAGDVFSKLGGRGDIKELPTIDRNRATGMAKKLLLDQTADLDLAIRRASHKPPERYKSAKR